jgi:hypothetical protein
MLKAEVQYLAEAGDDVIYYASSAGRNANFSVNKGMQTFSLEVADARESDVDQERDSQTGLANSGFMLVDAPSSVSNFLDSDQITSIYEEEVTALLKSITGASRVHIFDHTVRASDAEIREAKQIREPSTLVHNDYTTKSGFVCLSENLGADAEKLKQGHFQIINLWRPLVDPVQSWPLAFCDARSVEQSDNVDAERRAPNHTGEISLATYNTKHKWFYYPDMNPREVLIFKTFDSENGGRVPYAIHTAIDISEKYPNAVPRESIETRAFVFYT